MSAQVFHNLADSLSVRTLHLLVVLSGLTLVASAHADRADELFSSRCAGCHTLGKGQALAPRAGMLDLTRVGQRDPAELRAWLANPRSRSVDAACAAQLDRAQIDALLILFRARAQDDEGIPVIPVAAYRPARPLPILRSVERRP